MVFGDFQTPAGLFCGFVSPKRGPRLRIQLRWDAVMLPCTLQPPRLLVPSLPHRCSHSSRWEVRN